MTNNYDKVSPFYDALGRIVFFRSQMNAQIGQLNYIPQGVRILIAGGGTGWILEEIAKTHPQGLDITYVELSTKMIGLSRKRNAGKNKVQFVNEKIEDFYTSQNFDVILTPFLFDNFREKKAAEVFAKLDSMLKRDGRWLFVDFTMQNGSGFWKWLFLKMMYGFFKLWGITEASQLTEMTPHFEITNYKMIEEKMYYGGFIQALVYKKG